MKKFSIGTALLTMMLPLVFIACEKEDWEQCPDDTNGKPPAAKELKVVLDNDYMPAAKVDSAFATWEVNGISKTIRLQNQENRLSTSLTNFQQSGSGTLTIQIYSQVQVDGRTTQWETRLPYTLNQGVDKTLEGPKNIKDPSWNPRAIFKYGSTANERFSFIVAIRPNDPYFELKDVKPEYASRIDLIRSFYKTTGQLVVTRNWVCSASCLDSKGNLVNKDFFQGLPAQLNGKEWSKLRITAYFYVTNNPNKTYEYFDFNHEVQ